VPKVTADKILIYKNFDTASHHYANDDIGRGIKQNPPHFQADF
jgi:hypothetical protein